ncbi:MAG TPA: hypothetical protein VG144_10490 [Gaiellaceae bacterium]|nr:hypothetical protein [Gaiellaceae bacterium]
MRQLRVGSLSLVASVLVLAAGTAEAAQRDAVFKVTLTATLTKNWTFTRVEEEPGCTRTTRGVGRWQASLATRRAAKVRAIAAAGGTIRFSGAVLKALAGTASQTGSLTTKSTGDPSCERVARSVRCARERRSFRGASASFASPRRRVLRLGRLRRADVIRFQSRCLDVPLDVREIKTDLPLAPGPLDKADVFAQNVPRWFVTGDTEQVTTIEGDVTGRVTERVRWTLNFKRV